MQYEQTTCTLFLHPSCPTIPTFPHPPNLNPPCRQHPIISSRPHLYSHFLIKTYSSSLVSITKPNSLEPSKTGHLSTIQSSSFLTSPLDVSASNCIPTTLSSPPRVLIVGAGIGGLTLAILLELAGIPYELFERYHENKAYGIINHPRLRWKLISPSHSLLLYIKPVVFS